MTTVPGLRALGAQVTDRSLMAGMLVCWLFVRSSCCKARVLHLGPIAVCYAQRQALFANQAPQGLRCLPGVSRLPQSADTRRSANVWEASDMIL